MAYSLGNCCQLEPSYTHVRDDEEDHSTPNQYDRRQQLTRTLGESIYAHLDDSQKYG